jgi:hypothetical protein
MHLNMFPLSVQNIVIVLSDVCLGYYCHGNYRSSLDIKISYSKQP